MTWQAIDDHPNQLGALMNGPWFNLADLVDRTVQVVHYTDGTTSRQSPRRTITARVIAVSQAPDGDVAIRFDGLAIYQFSPTDVVRFVVKQPEERPRMGLGRSW